MIGSCVLLTCGANCSASTAPSSSTSTSIPQQEPSSSVSAAPAHRPPLRHLSPPLPAVRSRTWPPRWRSLALGTMRAFVEADAPRVQCTVHGVVVAAVPWTRHLTGLRGAAPKPTMCGGCTLQELILPVLPATSS